MKMRIDPRRAGIIAMMQVHHGFPSNKGMNQDLLGCVGLNSGGTDNFGVEISNIMSRMTMAKMAMMTAKSEM